jgi:hypothetical protein
MHRYALCTGACALLAQLAGMAPAHAQTSGAVTSSVFVHRAPHVSDDSTINSNWQAIVHPAPPPVQASQPAARARRQGRRARGGVAATDPGNASDTPLPPVPTPPPPPSPSQ